MSLIKLPQTNVRTEAVRHDAPALSFLKLLTENVLGLSSPEEIITVVERMLGEHMGVSRVLVAEATPDGETVLVPHTWEAEGMPVLRATTHRLPDYGQRLLVDYLAGRVHVRRDAAREYPEGPELNALRQLPALAAIDVPVLIGGKFTLLFVVHQATPRDWTDDEITLVRLVADRTAAEVLRARALRGAQTSETRFRQMADSMPQIVWTALPDGTIDYLNRKWYEYTGLPENDPAGLGSLAAFHQDDIPRLKAAWQQAVRGGGDYEIEVRLKNGAGGAFRWFINRGLPTRDLQGEVAGWHGTLTDIHDQRMAAERNRSIQERLAAALAMAEMGTFDWDLRTDTVTMDSRSRGLFGFESGQCIRGQDFFARIDPAQVQNVASSMRRHGQAGEKLEMEYNIRRPDGGDLTITSISNIVPDTDGEPARLHGVLMDVTGKRLAERERERFVRAIEEERASLAALMEKAPAFICVLRGPDHVFEMVNEDYRRLVGRRDLIGRRMREVLTEVEGQGFFAMLDKVYNTGEPVSGSEVPVAVGPEQRGGGRYRFLNFVYQALRGEDGGVNGIFVHGVDVTEAVEARQLVATSERLRRAALEGAGIGAFNIDLETREMRTDVRFRSIFGSAAETLSYDEAVARIHPDDRPVVLDKVAASTNPDNPQPYAVNHRVVLGDGSVRWVDVRGGVTYEGFGENRRPASFDGTVVDITGQKEAEDALAFQRHQLELIFRESPAAMALWRGNDLIFERVNPQYQAWFGDRSLVGKSLVEAVPELRGQGFDDILRRVLHTGEPFTGTEVLAQFAGGDGRLVEDRYFDFTYLQVRDPEGNPYGVYDHAVDVTSRVRARQALEESRELLRQALSERESLLEAERCARLEAEQAGRMKDEFLATLSHELRTPLNAIVGWAEILELIPEPSEDLVEGVKVISRNARAQTQIIEDILDMSRILSGKLRLDIQRFDLYGVLQAAFDSLKPAANGKGVHLSILTAPFQSCFTGDSGRLQQVFWNLISNAVKFTPKGGSVRIQLWRSENGMEAEVSDTGEGISREFLPRVFDRFRQADSSTTRIHSGLGLGLSIVKQIVELHGGTVRVQSPGPGQGSTFTVSLPLCAIPIPGDRSPEGGNEPVSRQTSAPLHPASSPLKGVSVLVVDDEHDAAAFVQRLLTAAGADVRTANSAGEALSLIRQEPPTVLVSDISMPVEDGYSLIRRVRALAPSEGGSTPAVALTAYARTVDRERTLESGFQKHISKPVEMGELIASIAELAGLSS